MTCPLQSVGCDMIILKLFLTSLATEFILAVITMILVGNDARNWVIGLFATPLIINTVILIVLIFAAIWMCIP